MATELDRNGGIGDGPEIPQDIIEMRMAAQDPFENFHLKEMIFSWPGEDCACLTIYLDVEEFISFDFVS